MSKLILLDRILRQWCTWSCFRFCTSCFHPMLDPNSKNWRLADLPHFSGRWYMSLQLDLELLAVFENYSKSLILQYFYLGIYEWNFGTGILTIFGDFKINVLPMYLKGFCNFVNWTRQASMMALVQKVILEFEYGAVPMTVLIESLTIVRTISRSKLV